MRHEVGHRHVASEDERHRPGEQTYEDEETPHEFQDALNTISESSAGAPWSDGGKPKSFCVPCSRNRSPVIIRNTDNIRGAHESKFVVMLSLLTLDAPLTLWEMHYKRRQNAVQRREGRRLDLSVWTAAASCSRGQSKGGKSRFEFASVS